MRQYRKMNTKTFRTRHEFAKKINPKGKDYIIGLDAGYSSMKVFYENGYFCFPSFVKKLPSENLSVFSEKDILYKDLDTGEVFMVGYTAQEMISSTDTNDTEGELFSRKRYGNRHFHILCNTAIGIASLEKKDNRDIFIQTGLPASYLKGDTGALKKALCLPANFALKIGTGRWQKVSFEVTPAKIHVIPQPAGSLYSVLIGKDGKYVPDAMAIMKANTLVLDIGFGTCDFYGLKSRTIACEESINEIGMRSVMKRASEIIMDEYQEEVRVPAMQSILESGKVICMNEDTMVTEERPVADIIKRASDEVFKLAMDRAKAVTNAFRDYRYLIVSGGTGEAWYEKVKEYLAGMKTLTILPGNINDSLPFLYSNVRGYYMFRYIKNMMKG